MHQDQANLFDHHRLHVYPRMIAAFYVLSFILLVTFSPNFVDPWGKPFGYDFITFWSAGHLTLQGHPELAFNVDEIFKAQRLAVPALDMLFLWHYPPTFQLISAGLALMPYILSYSVFVLLTSLAYVCALRPLMPWRTTWDSVFLALAFPGAFICMLHGQNSLLSAALMAGAFVFLDKRPAVAGIMIGLLIYKPQLGLLFPVVLAITGRWRVFAWAAATALAFIAIATAVLGADMWRIFVNNLVLVRHVLEAGYLPWEKMPSAFITLRLLGVPEAISYPVQFLVGTSAAIITFYVWWRCNASRLAYATLVLATLLLMPYTFDYEWAMLAIPLALAATELVRTGATRFEKLLLLTAYIGPLIMVKIAEATNLQVGFPLILVLFIWTAHKALVTADQWTFTVNWISALRRMILNLPQRLTAEK